jgi:hypothetical protein
MLIGPPWRPWKGRDWMAKKNRSTFEKLARERRLQERRERKQEKKLATRMAKMAGDAASSRERVDEDEARSD